MTSISGQYWESSVGTLESLDRENLPFDEIRTLEKKNLKKKYSTQTLNITFSLQ